MKPTKTWMMAGALVVAVLGAGAAAQPPAAPGPGGAPKAAAPAPPAAGAAAGAQNTSSKEPIDITADHGEMFHDERRVVYTGNVEAIQGTDRLRTPKLTIFWAKQEGASAKPAPAAAGGPGAEDDMGKIERMEAEGTVYFSTPTQNARGDHATYLAAPDTVTMIGNVVLVQDKNVSTGDKLVIDRKTDHSVLYANAGQKRVRGVFYQQDQGASPASGAPAAKPAPHS
jgi:lipopolysaccharide export system protein LptA